MLVYNPTIMMIVLAQKQYCDNITCTVCFHTFLTVALFLLFFFLNTSCTYTKIVYITAYISYIQGLLSVFQIRSAWFELLIASPDLIILHQPMVFFIVDYQKQYSTAKQMAALQRFETKNTHIGKKASILSKNYSFS